MDNRLKFLYLFMFDKSSTRRKSRSREPLRGDKVGKTEPGKSWYKQSASRSRQTRFGNHVLNGTWSKMQVAMSIKSAISVFKKILVKET